MTDSSSPVDRLLSSEVAYSNRWMMLREDRFVRNDGTEGLYAYIEKPDFALVIPFENDGFHLIEQFRYPIKQRSLEFPQGTYPDLKDGDPAELARRELAEETGLHAKRFEHLGHLYGANGMSSQGFHVFVE